jgi:hypothetical protein
MGAIVIAAMRVRGEAPGAWETFLLAVREHSAMTAMEMVKCPPENLPRAQGMAQMAQELTTTLMNAPKLYEKMQATRKQQ